MAQFDEERATYTANGARVDMSTKIAGEDLTNDILKIRDNATYTNITASALIKTGAGVLKGIIINSATSGATINLSDNTATAGTAIIGQWTLPTVGTSTLPVVMLLPAVEFSTGLYVTLTGTINITLLWK
jgi:hypothetical protein